MDVGETKGEHGGLHESDESVRGMCLGPAVGALSLYLVPGFPTPVPILSPHWLACGTGWLIGVRVRGGQRKTWPALCPVAARRHDSFFHHTGVLP